MRKLWVKSLILILTCAVSFSVYAGGLADERFEEAMLLYKGYKKEKQQHILEMALAYTKNAIELDDNDYQKFLLLGLMYNEMQNNPIASPLALEAFNDAVHLEPKDKTLRLVIAEDLYKKEKYSHAVRYFEQAVNLDKKLMSPGLTGVMTTCYVKASEQDLGIAFFRNFAENSEAPPAYLLLNTAVLLKNEYRYNEAQEILNRVINNTGFSVENREYAKNLMEKIKADEY